MSELQLWTVLGRSKLDLGFGSQVARCASAEELGAVLRAEGYELSEAEIATFRTVSVTPSVGAGPAGMLGPNASDIAFERQAMRKRFTAQVARANDLGAYTVTILKQTLDRASSAFKTISRMNTIMFFTGITLFVSAAGLGLATGQPSYSLVLGGLGAANFVAIFFLEPIERTQTALSNLVQVEIAFLDFFEQITLWDAYAQVPNGTPPMPSPEHIAKASAQLQVRSREVIELLQNNVENAPTRRRARRRRTHDSAQGAEPVGAVNPTTAPATAAA